MLVLLLPLISKFSRDKSLIDSYLYIIFWESIYSFSENNMTNLAVWIRAAALLSLG